MDTNRKSKWQVRLATVLIFVLGFAAGALAFNTYQKWSRSRSPVTRQQRFEKMLDRLQLSSEQKTQAHRKESEPRFEEIRRQADERLQKVLTPEQWRQFQQERDANRSRRGRGRP